MTSASVSVLVPAYNAALFLREAIDSLLAQTHRPTEIIVIDDGSVDDTPTVCREYEGRIVYIRQENRGEAGARNAGLGVARGEFVCLLDADDVCAPDRIERQVQALRAAPEACACFTGHWVFTEGSEPRAYAGDPARALKSAAEFSAALLVHPITMMFRREAVRGLAFPVGVTTGGDMLFTGLLRRRGPFTILPDVLYGYRRHPHQITARMTDLDSLEQRVAWLRATAPSQWPELDVSAFEALAWNALAEALGGHYWARRRREFLHLRSVLRERWPASVPRPASLELRWYPDALWKAKTLVDSLQRRG